jgi:hypothetical protein
MKKFKSNESQFTFGLPRDCRPEGGVRQSGEPWTRSVESDIFKKHIKILKF